MTTDRVIAKYLALTNAEEFIRGHGEEGGMEPDEYPCEIDTYLSEAEKIADRLSKEAAKHMKKYLKQLKESGYLNAKN